MMDIEAHGHTQVAAITLAEGLQRHTVELAALHSREHVDSATVFQEEGLAVFDGRILSPAEHFEDGWPLHEGKHLAFDAGGRTHLEVGKAETGQTAEQGQDEYHLEHTVHYLSSFLVPKGGVLMRPNMGASRLMSITAKGAPSVYIPKTRMMMTSAPPVRP